ncbi:MAG: hypothetical protein J1G05_02955 [Clostridiales bacterium]|nr:hypothetical protein [Clostridiales bacterium]
MKKGKKLPKNIMCVAVCALIIGILTLICASGQIAYEVAETFECWRPDYEKVDISPILDKEQLTDDDYALLYAQTGLTKLGIDRALEKGSSGKKRILYIQDDYFKEQTVKHDKFLPYICFCHIDGHISNIYLEDGDVVVSASTQLIGWRMGHSGLVTNGAGEKVLQAAAIGTVSDIGDIDDFTDAVAFMVLSPKVDKEIKQQVVKYAKENLLGISYDPFRGLFSSKNKITTTQCAHLVWYAYNQFGIDIDGNGGGLVTPQDFANSPKMEVVQVFGFKPDKLWK